MGIGSAILRKLRTVSIAGKGNLPLYRRKNLFVGQHEGKAYISTRCSDPWEEFNEKEQRLDGLMRSLDMNGIDSCTTIWVDGEEKVYKCGLINQLLEDEQYKPISEFETEESQSWLMSYNKIRQIESEIGGGQE